MGWFIPLIIGIILQVIAYLLMPKPKQPKPPALADAEDPVAEAGIPIPYLFGSKTIKGLNVLWYGDKNKTTRKIKA